MSTETRAVLAIALSIGFLLLWQHFFAARPPAVPPQAPGYPTADSAEGRAGAGAQPPAAAPEPDRGEAAISPAVAGERERILVMETPAQRVKITSVGARVLSWRLLGYTGEEGHPLELVPDQGGRPEALPLQLVVPGDPARTRRLNEAVYACSSPRPTDAGQEITCRWSDGRSETVDKTLVLPERGYLGTLRVRLASASKTLPLVAWAPGLIRDEGPGSYGQPARGVHLVLGNPDGVKRLPASEAGEWAPAPGPLHWAGLESQYFAVAFIPETGPGGFALFGREREERRAEALGVAWAPGGEATARLFVGPKSYDLLRGLDAELHLGLRRLVDFGSLKVIEIIAVGLFMALKWLYRQLHSYGLAIVVLTFFVRLGFYPVTHRSMVNMRRLQKQMKRLQPKVQHLKEQYARKPKTIDNRHKMNQELMELYRREGVNPMASMGGCLPLLLQIPILWALYNLLSAAIELRRAPFLYLDDLSARDPYFVTPIIMGASMWFQQRMTGTAVPDAAQRWMLNLMPWFMTWLFKDFPSGLVLYWLVNNLLGIVQQYLINRQADAEEAPAGRERVRARRA